MDSIREHDHRELVLEKEGFEKRSEWLRTTLSSIGDAVIATDAEGRVTFMNVVAERLTGWSQPEAIGRPLPDVFRIVDEQTRLVPENPALRALRTGTVVGLANHTILVSRDESERPIDDSAAPIRGDDGTISGAVLVFRDVTERRQAEEARARLAAIVEGSDDAIVSKSLDGTIRSWNAGAERLFGYTAAEAIGRSIYMLIPEELRDEEREILDRLRRGERVEHFETVRVARDGRRLDISLTISPIRDRHGTIIGASKVARDITARKQTDAMIRASEERFRNMADHAPVLIWISDSDGGMVWVNRSWLEFTGRSLEQERGAGWTLGIHPDDAPRALGEFRSRFEARAPFSIEYRLRHRDGSWRRMLDIGRPLQGAGGEFAGYVGTCVDVTENKRAEEQALEAAASNAKFRTLFEQGSQFAGILTLDGTVVEANRLSLDGCGYSREEVVGRPFWDCGWWNPSTALQAMIRHACETAATGGMFRIETPYYVADGTERLVDFIMAPVKDAAGRVLFLAPTGADVTDRVEFERGLRRQTERLRLLWESASVLLTSDEPHAMMGGLFAKIAPHFGLDAYFNFLVDETGECLRLESSEGISEEDAGGIRRVPFGVAICGAVAVRREPIAATHIQESDDPRVRLVKRLGVRSYACNPLLAGDRLLGTLSFASRSRDAFEPDELEFLRTVCRYVTSAYERVRLIRELRDSDRKKDDFIALLAHELRNPLAPIRNGLQVMRLSADPVVRERSIVMMDRQLTHMVRLIDDLLDVSRINRNKMELRIARVSLADVVANSVETAQPLIEKAGHTLEVSLPGSPVYLDADLTRLSQVFSNLLTNSAKYTPRGGKIHLDAMLRGDRVVVAVRDNGIGIPPGSLREIFSMFSQVDRSIERHTGGLGIGLALVKGLVEMHGGTVSAASDGEGRGSTFTVTLPTRGATGGAAVADEAAADPRSGTGRRVLVVDDHLDGAESLAMMLRLLRNDVRTARDGHEAIATAERFRPDVILMDVGMPGIDGLEATRQIRRRAWGRSPTIIALTGWGQEEDRRRSREAGCDGHLVKPVSLPDLQRLLEEMADQTG